MGWQDILGGALTGFSTGDPMAWQRNKLEQAFKQFQMQQAMQELEMRKDMLTLEKQKADLAFKHSKYTLSDLFGGTTTDTVGNKDAGMAGGEEYAVPTGEPTKEVSRPLNLQELIQKFTQSDVPVDIAAKAIPFLTMMQKEKEKPMAVGKHIYKPDTNEWIQNPYIDPDDKAPQKISFDRGDQHITEIYEGGKLVRTETAPRYKPDSGDKPRKPHEIGKDAAGLRKEFNNLPEVKEYNTVRTKISAMESAYKEAQTTKNFVAADQAMITLFNKMTDPQSVVRESEYARTGVSMPLINAIKGKASKIRSGGAGLTSSERDAIMKMANLFNASYKQIYGERVKEYRGYAQMQGLDPNMIAKEEIINKDPLGIR